MRRLIIGTNGQVGRHLRHHFPDATTISIGRKELDLSKPETVQQVLEDYRPDIILNAAAYTQVDQAETDVDAAFRVNRDAVAEIAQYAASHNSLLVHYSTDYVFDGYKETPYHEKDPANPLSVYGDSKKQGEDAIRTSECQHLIFRTSWVYCDQGKNFPNTILSLARERDELKVISDQHGTPTHADIIALLTARCITAYDKACDDERKEMVGLYHLTNSGHTSWFEFAQYLIKGAKARGAQMICAPDKIEPIPSGAYHAPAQRPANSSLDCSKICKIFDLSLPSWTTYSDNFLDKWVAKNQNEA